jgi:two-component system NarL family sensor kinase
MVQQRLSVAQASDNPELMAILVQHAYRGIRVQFLLRLVLIAFMIAAITAVPPARDRPAGYAIVGCYALCSLAVALWSRTGGVGPVRWMWVVLIGDAAALAALTLVAGASAEQTWTADLLVNGFFLIPMIAATQLRPLVCAAVAISATAAYFAASVATKAANTEPWGSIIVRTVAIAGLSAGCIALSWVQLSRVLTIARLAQDRTDLLEELLTLETRERSALAEQLHDGALQYILAARHDLEDARADGDPGAFERIEFALAESSGLLRSTVTQLHPAVLHQAGLPRALRDLAGSLTERARLSVDVEVVGWPESATTLDGLLYGCARELITNVVKHAGAQRLEVELLVEADRIHLRVGDDGRGVAADAPAARLAQGHIGLASMRTRVAAAGGCMTVRPGPVAGTTVEVIVPYEAVESG